MFVSKLCTHHLYTNIHKSSATYCRVFLPSGANWRQRTWKPGAARLLRTKGNPTELSPIPRSSPAPRKTPKTRRGNVRCGRLPPAGTGGQARSGGRDSGSWGRFLLLAAESQGQDFVCAVPELSINPCASLNDIIGLKSSLIAVS